jgi:hypothetical protein
MSWLRIDDGFAEHYKIAELTDREFRVWVRILCYAARNNGRAGRLTAAMRDQIVGLTPTITTRLVSLGLLDPDEEEGVLAIHDWKLYANVAIAEKVAHYLAAHPDASANDVVRAVRGKRELVLHEVKRFREGSEGTALVVPAVVPAVVLKEPGK